VRSKLSFILPASVVESRISSPMATVSCLSCETLLARRDACALDAANADAESSGGWDSSDDKTDVAYWPLFFGGEEECLLGNGFSV